MRRRSLGRQRQTARVAAHCSGRRSLGATLATSPWPPPLMNGPLRALRINRLAMLRFARFPVQYPPRVQSRNSRRTVEGFDDSVMLNSTLTRGCQSYPTEPPARHSRSALPSASARASASLRKIALSCCPLWGSFASFSASPLHVRLAPDTFHEDMPEGSEVPEAKHGTYSITSSARARNDSGIVSPIALAVVRLMTTSNLVGCSTGISPGFAPRKILST